MRNPKDTIVLFTRNTVYNTEMSILNFLTELLGHPVNVADFLVVRNTGVTEFRFPKFLNK